MLTCLRFLMTVLHAGWLVHGAHVVTGGLAAVDGNIGAADIPRFITYEIDHQRADFLRIRRSTEGYLVKAALQTGCHRSVDRSRMNGVDADPIGAEIHR